MRVLAGIFGCCAGTSGTQTSLAQGQIVLYSSWWIIDRQLNINI